MARQYLNTNCPLNNTEYCERLNMQGCDTCTVASRDKKGIESLMEDMDAMKDLMPEDGIYELYTGDECVLCKGENKGERVCYGVSDLGNPQPEHIKRSSIGLKVRSRAGSIVPVQLSCCKDCKRRFLRSEYIVLTITAIAAVLGMLLVAIRPLNQAMKAVWMGLPIVVFAVITVGGWVASLFVRRALVKKYSELTYMNIFELPKLAQMKDKGWFELVDSKVKGVSKLVFANKRMEQGIYTGDRPQARAEQPEE